MQWSPTFDFLQASFVPALQAMGIRLNLSLQIPGFYPRGGGQITAEIQGTGTPEPVEWMAAQAVCDMRAESLVCKLPEQKGLMALAAVRQALALSDEQCHSLHHENSWSPGNVLSLKISRGNITETITRIGRRGLSAEVLAREVVAEANAYLAADIPIGEYLADQLLIPLALAGGGGLRTMVFSLHSQTNIEVIQKFLDVQFLLSDRGRDGFLIQLKS